MAKPQQGALNALLTRVAKAAVMLIHTFAPPELSALLLLSPDQVSHSPTSLVQLSFRILCSALRALPFTPTSDGFLCWLSPSTAHTDLLCMTG